MGTWGGSASATGTTSTTTDANSGGSKTAVVTPLLEMFVFGNTIGLPLACSDAGSVVSIIGAQTQSSKILSPLTVELDKDCSQLSSQGLGTCSRRWPRVRPSHWSIPGDSFIADLAGGLTTTGTPVRPLAVPLRTDGGRAGGTVAFFEGT